MQSAGLHDPVFGVRIYEFYFSDEETEAPGGG